jgi:phosphoglycerate dehydrogenase-like enzyme
VHYLSLLDFDEPWLDALRTSTPGLRVTQVHMAASADEVPDEVWADVEVLHTTSVLPAPGQAPNLRWVQLDTSGCDHLRDTWLWRSDIPISTIGGVSPVPLAEYVLLMVLGLAHRLPELRAFWQDPQWPSPDERWRRFGPRPVAGTTMGIVGYGRIGREIGRLARAHGMTVVATSRTGRPLAPETHDLFHDPGRQPLDAAYDGVELFGSDGLHEVLGRSDHVVVVVPLTDETTGLVDEKAVRAIKPGAVLVNVARGGIVDERAVAAALADGHLSGAALDVFDEEPQPAGSPWWSAPGVLATPHVSGLAPHYRDQVQVIVAENLRRHLAGEPLVNQVDRVRGY